MKGRLARARRPQPPLTGERPRPTEEPLRLTEKRAPTSPIPLSPRPRPLAPGIYTGRQKDRSPKSPFLSDETARWLSSLLIVLAVYATPLAWWSRSSDAPEASAPPPAAMVVELAPLPMAPAPPTQVPTDAEQTEEKPPPEPEPEPEPQQAKPEPVPVPEAEKAEATIPPGDKPRQEEEPLPPEEQVNAPSAPPEAPQEDDVAAAPDRGAPAPALNSSRVPNWQNQLMLSLNEAKRYPTRARRYRQEGVAYLRFTMDRDGKVLEKSIDQGSGYRLLDREALALIERAQPLPKPPVELTGETLEFVVPVEFFLSR